MSYPIDTCGPSTRREKSKWPRKPIDRYFSGFVGYHPKMTERPCPFCTLPDMRVVSQNEHAVVVLDAYPVTLGHSLVIPKRHVGSFFETTPSERLALLTLLDHAKVRANAAHHPAGYNIGVNDGSAAGQTVPHLHIHLIPRYLGDQPDPRGGVRWVIPEKADYWSDR